MPAPFRQGETTMSIEHCGVLEHDDTCLCDVVIPGSTPWVTDAVRDMWMGLEIVEIRGYDGIWDDDSIINYLQDLVYAKDRWEQSLPKVSLSTSDDRFGKYRETLRFRLQCPDAPSILDVAKELGINYSELMYVLFTNRYYMSKETLLEFESDVRNRRFHSAHMLSKKYGMALKSTRKLHSYWGVPFADKMDVRTPDQILVDELVENSPGLKATQIMDIVIQEFGKDCGQTANKIRYRRHYLLNCKGNK
jgi:hypothetical protein